LYKALVLRKDEEFKVAVESLEDTDLPEGDVEVGIEYSTLNYKDALAITNTSPVVRKWPMVCGIDGSGVVLRSTHPDWKVGDRFIHNGWGYGETRWGLMAERSKVQGQGLVKLPSSISTLQAMAIGTAGYTAMLCVLALEKHGLSPQKGEVLVTGATGGVGSVAISLLSHKGYSVTASTGKGSESDYLKALGAKEVIDRVALSEPGKPFQKERWAGVVDAVGSHTLANALAQCAYGAAVASCGLAQGMDLPTTVMPFILRGVSLLGIDSVMAPLAIRQEAWSRLAKDLDLQKLAHMTQVIALQDVVAQAHALRSGQVKGRLVVKVS